MCNESTMQLSERGCCMKSNVNKRLSVHARKIKSLLDLIPANIHVRKYGQTLFNSCCLPLPYFYIVVQLHPPQDLKWNIPNVAQLRYNVWFTIWHWVAITHFPCLCVFNFLSCPQLCSFLFTSSHIEISSHFTFYKRRLHQEIKTCARLVPREMSYIRPNSGFQ